MPMIINLTQHPATPEQQAAGVINLPEPQREQLRSLLTFEEIPDPQSLRDRAAEIAALAASQAASAAMIGGAPFFMASLEAALRAVGIRPLYAFSRREVVECTMPDGSVQKTAVFRHLGFVDPTPAG